MGTTLIGPRGTWVDAQTVNGYGALCVTDVGGGGGGSTLPSTLYNGTQTVSSAGTAVAIATSQTLSNGVTIKASASNTGVIYVGNSSVSSSNGLPLTAGESIPVAIDDLAKVYIDADVSGEGIEYIGG